MQINRFHDPIAAENVEQLRQHLRFRNADGFACFWMWHDKGTAFAVMLNGDRAYVHFFPAGGSAGCQAVSPQSKEPDDYIDFLADNHEPTPMPRSLTVSAEQASQALEEFFVTGQRPSSLNWAEL
jgi:hypothetical protein